MSSRPLALCSAALALLGSIAIGGCAAHHGGAGRARAVSPPVVDSLTLGLWRFDETGGLRAVDAGASELDGAIGLDTRSTFGRFGGARLFGRSAESFALVPYTPELESSLGFTIEAWVRPNAYGQYELTPIASRWTQGGNEHSWLFGLLGRRLAGSFATLQSPGYFQPFMDVGPAGRLILLIQPERASGPLGFTGITAIPLDTWTHVAATWDGEVVRLWIDGRLDAQYAQIGSVRRSPAPLQIGNAIDPRRLTDFNGQLRLDPTADANPYYAFDGAIDELRLSSVARSSFDSSPLH